MASSQPTAVMNGVDTASSGQAKATLKDVATLAGVSVATASKALNGQPKVNADTRTRVQAAALQLSYVPNVFAQSLISGKSNSIGAITSDFQGMFCTPILIGAEDELGASSNTVLLANARGDAMLERNHLEYLLSRNVDGVILINDKTTPRAPMTIPNSIPAVYAYAPSTNPDDCSITSDNVGVGRIVVEHLLSCGRSKIAIIGGDRRANASGKAALDRLEGYTAALHEAGLEPAGPVRFSDWSEPWGRAATRMLLDQGVDFDAVICQSDVIARGCLDALKERGLSIPRDVAVVGHDNWMNVSLGSAPPLTTVDNNLEQIGHRAARALLDAIDNRPHHGVEYVPCSLVQRESTIPLR